ncbi:MAG: PHP domain-containing protein [Thermoplasmata archaeon]|nr:PHP domain-containing protein [Thermoplasmata archaeon]
MEKMDFHIHSDYSDDGSASLEDIVTEAIRWGLVAIGIVDHVRGDAAWLEEREARISGLRKKYADDIAIFSGIEVKVVDDQGTLEVEDRALHKADYVVASFHGTPEHVSRQSANGDHTAVVRWWCDSMLKLLEEGGRAQIIGHPDRVLNASRLTVDPEKFGQLLEMATKSRMFLEWNPVTTYPAQPFVQELGKKASANIIYASDAHTIGELADAYRGHTSFEEGMVERGNAALLALLKSRQATRLR